MALTHTRVASTPAQLSCHAWSMGHGHLCRAKLEPSTSETQAACAGPTGIIMCAQISVASMAPITASQFGTNRLVQQLMMGKPDGGELSGAQKFVAAGISGSVSGLIASPTELIIIQQQVSTRASAGVHVRWTACLRGVASLRMPGRSTVWANGRGGWGRGGHSVAQLCCGAS